MTDVDMGGPSLLSFTIHLILFFGISYLLFWAIVYSIPPVSKAYTFIRYALAEVIHTFITNTRNNH